ncbi:MAG: hypothetical protein WCW53_14240 [Syntrophales bacterium]|jgi:hypothetical protein
MSIVDRAKQAIWKKAGLPHDGKGYVTDSQLNLVAGVTSEMIKGDYDSGSGQEWLSKIRAIHSSSALVANTFGRWKSIPSQFTFADISGFSPPSLEAKCHSGLGGTPPNLDVLLQSSDTVFGIESKFLEPLKLTVPKFAASYSRNRLPLCEDAWWSLLERVRQWPPSHLDAAQLIKHYLGLRKQFPDGKKVWLVYLYWRPVNVADISEYSRHAEDLEKFQSAIEGAESIRFMALDYLELWDSWEKNINMAGHAKLLKNRYCVEI